MFYGGVVMKVTIYQNCKLNNKYEDVFFKNSYLETYLATLTSTVVLNDSNIYSRNEDRLWIDGISITNFKQYNYLKIEDSIGTFYAFINDIKWVNECYDIYYEEDIMSNWFSYIKVRNGLLTRTLSKRIYNGN